MPNYTRALFAGGTWFFTAVTDGRSPWLAEPLAVRCLTNALRAVRRRHPFGMDALVVLPDHVHAIWRLPPGDTLFSLRWELVKKHCNERLRQLDVAAPRPAWQPRFWEHLIRDDSDFEAHVDYVHFNPVKHGLVAAPCDWAWSSFHRYVAAGVYTNDWAASPRETKALAKGE